MTSEAKHTPEPWELHQHLGPRDPYFQLLNGSWDIAHSKFSANGSEVDEANGRRIVACVNACAGIPTEQLQAGCVANLVNSAVNVMKRLQAYGDVELKDGNDCIAAGYHEPAVDLFKALAPFQKGDEQ